MWSRDVVLRQRNYWHWTWSMLGEEYRASWLIWSRNGSARWRPSVQLAGWGCEVGPGAWFGFGAVSIKLIWFGLARLTLFGIQAVEIKKKKKKKVKASRLGR